MSAEEMWELDIQEDMLLDEYKQGLIPWNELYDTFTGNLTEKGTTIQRVKRKLMDKHEAMIYKDAKNPITGEKYQKAVGIKPTRLSRLIQTEYNYAFLTLRDTKEIYYFNRAFYQNNGETIIQETAEDFMGDFSTQHLKNEIVSDIRDFNHVERDIFKTDPDFINLENGVYNLKTDELLDHCPDYFFLHKIPVRYDRDASYRGFEDFLHHICMKQGERRPVIEDTIQEYMGFSLIREYPRKRYMVLDGGGDNAKTTLLDIVLALVGAQNNTSVSLQELNNRPFAKSQLYGKLTNISDDLPNKGLKYTGVIKQITGNSPMWADIKNHKKGIHFTNYAKPWYACNELPETEDITDAFFSRQLQITLLNKYVPTGNSEIDNYTVFEADSGLVKTLTAPEKLSGILNFALKGLKRLKKQDYFSLDKDITTDEKRQIWLRKTNPIHSFLQDEIETLDDYWVITVDAFATEVIDYCDRNGFDRPTRHKITSKMHDAGMKKQQKTVKGESRTWCWVGIKHITNTEINHYIGPRKDGVIC